MRKIIINADDFGLCAPVSEGIVLAHRRGILTSATLMVNTPGFDQAVSLARETPTLGVGLHLNIVRGRPLSPPGTIPSLLGPDGRFLAKPGRILRDLALGRIASSEIERELRAQMEKGQATGLPLTHLDSEKHMHAFPPVFKIVLRLGREFGFRKVRFIREWGLSRHPVQSLKAAWLSTGCALMRRRVLEAGFVITERFYGICNSGRMDASRYREIFRRGGEGTAEIGVHPGFQSAELFDVEAEVGRYYINAFREGELQALLDPGLPAIARRAGVELVNFNGI
ncbi:MAG: ChbG/HpnK family deacetylase [Candidatus Aminicenantes bacterium]|nr:ChbG/HpnK family deacetylase [Candidatus Aminicenantes bacterium]